MAVTIRDIAKKAGVSRGTVDRVLHHRKGVKPEVEERVTLIAEELGFSPNLAGKALATRKQPLRLGCLLPSIGNPFFKEVIEGFKQAESELSDFGVSVDIIQIKSFEVDIHLKALKQLRKQQYNGVCITSIDVPQVQEQINCLSRDGTAVITVNTDITESKRLCYVGPDYYHGGKTASGFLSLVEAKPLRLVILTGSFHIKGHNERIKGFLQGLERRNHTYEIQDTIEGFDDDHLSYANTLKSLKEHPHANCLFVVAAGVEGACKAIKELDLQQTIRIVCFDDIPAVKALIREGSISFTFCQEPRRQGYEAIQKLFFHLMDKALPVEDTITNTIIKIQENLDD